MTPDIILALVGTSLISTGLVIMVIAFYWMLHS